VKVIVIGGSTGSIDALKALLPAVPDRAQIVIVVHIPSATPSLLPEVLGGYTRLTVVEAVDKLPLEPGMIVVGPPDYHVLVERERTIALSRDAAEHFSRPSIDALFASAATALGADAIGVLLTGANDDGAVGLAAIQMRGGRIAVQDPASSLAPEMPRAAIARCRPDLVAEPQRIGAWLASLVGAAP
jgi:two-component system chemotaxis response regulator CheB